MLVLGSAIYGNNRMSHTISLSPWVVPVAEQPKF